MKYLTKNNKNQYTLPINVTADMAAKVSEDVARIVEGAPPEAGRGMAGAVRWWLAQFDPASKAQAQIDLALEHLDCLFDGLNPEQQVFAERVRMALTGCETNTATVFTGELSPEYLERYGNG